MRRAKNTIETWFPWSKKYADVQFSRMQRRVWGIIFTVSGFVSIVLTVCALVDLLPFADAVPFTGPVQLQVRCIVDAIAIASLPFLAMFLFQGAVASCAGVPSFGGDQY